MRYFCNVRVLAICLLSVFISCATGFGQLLKINALVAHYSEHKQENSELAFVDFLFMHYVGDDNNANDEERDKQLPFKTNDNCNSVDVQFIPHHSEGVKQEEFTSEAKNGSYRLFDIPASFYSFIWQPPEPAL